MFPCGLVPILVPLPILFARSHQVKMAKTPAAVLSFLADLEAKLRPLGLAERAKLLQLKKEEHAQRGWKLNEEFHLWDYRYYDRLWVERTLALGEF